LIKQLSRQAISVSHYHSCQLNLVATLQRIGHWILMYVNRGYHSQWASKHRFYGLHKTRKCQFHAGRQPPDGAVLGSQGSSSVAGSDRYRTVPVMTERFVWPAQTLLNGTYWYRTFAVVSGR
jgi:hypothetical protein